MFSKLYYHLILNSMTVNHSNDFNFPLVSSRCFWFHIISYIVFGIATIVFSFL